MLRAKLPFKASKYLAFRIFFFLRSVQMRRVLTQGGNFAPRSRWQKSHFLFESLWTKTRS
ncbi:hypothetical protein A3K70_02960 [Candidatus Bathyarchaeota archaeon RBG_16_48_13]|nr:MAG: hypothetical protein A3K70_02960 [Candidatus Bathyarchaeota archaeon RBG_16_48_13]